jgi:hypothetical protein
MSQKRLALDAGMERSYVNAALGTRLCEHSGGWRTRLESSRSCCWKGPFRIFLYKIPGFAQFA